MSDVEPKKLDGAGNRNCGSLETAWYNQVVEEAINLFGTLEIIGSDQRSRYTLFGRCNLMNNRALKHLWMGKSQPSMLELNRFCASSRWTICPTLPLKSERNAG